MIDYSYKNETEPSNTSFILLVFFQVYVGSGLIKQSKTNNQYHKDNSVLSKPAMEMFLILSQYLVSYSITLTSSQCSDEPAHPRSLVRTRSAGKHSTVCAGL